VLPGHGGNWCVAIMIIPLLLASLTMVFRHDTQDISDHDGFAGMGFALYMSCDVSNQRTMPVLRQCSLVTVNMYIASFNTQVSN
jgi:hypothetical protein